MTNQNQTEGERERVFRFMEIVIERKIPTFQHNTHFWTKLTGKR